MVSISGGADSDIMLDMIERVRHTQNEVRYVFFDTGLEFAATKRHLDYLDKKYGIHIERVKAKVPVPLGVRKYGLPFLSKTISNNIVVYGRMIEIYLVTSIAPIPTATMLNREWGSMDQNYLRSLLALGFQTFLIIVCVAIYAVLVQNIATATNISAAIWTCMGYTVLLCFCLFKTGSLAKSVFNAH